MNIYIYIYIIIKTPIPPTALTASSVQISMLPPAAKVYKSQCLPQAAAKSAQMSSLLALEAKLILRTPACGLWLAINRKMITKVKSLVQHYSHDVRVL